MTKVVKMLKYVNVLAGLYCGEINCGIVIGPKNCNKWAGPSGGVHCINAIVYDQPQWATCLTDAYIQTKSKGQYRCKDRTATYCYYQCEAELYSNDNGKNLESYEGRGTFMAN